MQDPLLQDKIKVYENSMVPKFLGRYGVTIFGRIYLDRSAEDALSAELLQHEVIHVLQQRRDGMLWFYVKYLGEFVANLFRFKSWEKAYKNVTYELEADLKQQSQTVSMAWIEVIKGEK